MDKKEAVVRRLRWGIAILLVGLWIWLSALGVPYISFSRNWPLLLVALGVYIIVRRLRRGRRERRRSARVIIADVESGRLDVDRAVDEMKGRK